MKKFFLIIVLPALLYSSSSFSEEVSNLDKNIAYFFGYSFANSLKEGGNEKVDVETMLKGFSDSLKGLAPNLSEEQQAAVIAEVRKRQAEVQQQRIDGLAEASRSFLEYNKNQEGVKVTASGLQYKVIEAGSGLMPTTEDSVKVHYTGKLINEQVFDSSVERGEPVTFPLGQVIAGWTEGLQLMKAGGKTQFFIPPELGYGPGGTRTIPPNAVLIFDVELIEVNPKAETAN